MECIQDIRSLYGKKSLMLEELYRMKKGLCNNLAFFYSMPPLQTVFAFFRTEQHQHIHGFCISIFSLWQDIIE